MVREKVRENHIFYKVREKSGISIFDQGNSEILNKSGNFVIVYPFMRLIALVLQIKW